MSRAIVCPDKFRGTLRADEAARAMARGCERAGFTDIREVPLADGGEGTLDTLLAARGGSRRTARVTGPLGAAVDAEWGVLPGGTAIIEMARASGLALVVGQNDPLRASTRGTGELIAAARAQGMHRFLVAVGGSATTDGGLAAVETLGWSLKGLDVTVACDVETPFLDAARVYGPQKGASDAQIALLTRRLEKLADQYRARTGVDVTKLTGAGAAGDSRADWPQSAPNSYPVSTRLPTRSGSKPNSTTRCWSSPVRGASTRQASKARLWEACSTGATTPTSTTSP